MQDFFQTGVNLNKIKKRSIIESKWDACIVTLHLVSQENVLLNVVCYVLESPCLLLLEKIGHAMHYDPNIGCPELVIL